MIETGRICVKIAGRDAGNYCAIVEVLDKNYVVIGGNVRRRKCNLVHLEPLDKAIKIKDKATTEEVLEAMKKEGIEVKEHKKATKQRKEKTAKTKPAKKTTAKKAAKK